MFIWHLAQAPKDIPVSYLQQCEITLPQSADEKQKNNRCLLIDIFHNYIRSEDIDRVGMCFKDDR